MRILKNKQFVFNHDLKQADVHYWTKLQILFQCFIWIGILFRTQQQSVSTRQRARTFGGFVLGACLGAMPGLTSCQRKTIVRTQNQTISWQNREFSPLFDLILLLYLVRVRCSVKSVPTMKSIANYWVFVQQNLPKKKFERVISFTSICLRFEFWLLDLKIFYLPTFHPGMFLFYMLLLVLY